METSNLIKQLDTALELQRNGGYSEALSIFEELERHSQHPQDIAGLRFFQVSCLIDLGRLDDALELLSKIDKRHLIFSKQIDYEYERARIERAFGRTDKALELVTKALQMAKIADSDAMVEIKDEMPIDITGSDHLTLVNKEELAVVSGALNTLRALLLAESGQCDEAIPLLESVPRDDLGWAEATIALGDCKIRKRLYREAISDYLRVTSQPTAVHPFYREAAVRNIGCAYYYLGEYPQAIEYLTKVTEKYDDEPDLKADLFGLLASAYTRLGMTKEAAKYSVFSSGTRSIQ
jgi:tetratricopeptide (TPR) repeat protein